MKGSESLFRPVIWVGLIGVASKVMGAFGGILLAYRFGADQATDAYLLAKTVPIGVYLILDSVVYNTLVPLLRRREESAPVFRTLLVIFFFAATAVATAVYFGATQVVALLAHGADSATQAEAAALQKITAWAIIYAVPASCLKAWNAAQARYVAAALDGFVLSGTLLLTLLFMSDDLGIAPVAIALPGAFVLLLLIQAVLGRAVLHLEPRTPLRKLPGRYLSRLAGPLFLLNGAQQAQILLVVGLAAFYGKGAVSQVNYSYAIAQIPVGILDLILFSTLFPFATQLASDRRVDDLLRATFGAAVTLLLFSLPTALWLMVHRDAVVDTLLTRGHFDAADANTTTALLFGHGLAIPAWVLEALACRVLFALGQHRRYLAIVVTRLVAFAALAVPCLTILDLPGISIAFAGSFVVGAALAGWVVWKALAALRTEYVARPIQRAQLLPSLYFLATITTLVALSALLTRWVGAELDPVYQLLCSAILATLIVGVGTRILIAKKYFQV